MSSGKTAEKPLQSAEEVAFDERGLVPCVVQDWNSGEVLTLAYMNLEALQRTIESGETWFWSRSRSELWHKGETSGNTQHLRGLRYDCDADAVLALVEPTGPACHTGERSCFYRSFPGQEGSAPHEALPALGRVLRERRRDLPAGSYTADLLRAGSGPIGAKVEEEAEEAARAAREESDDRLAAEAADLIYHLGVLLAERELELTAALEELNGRRR